MSVCPHQQRNIFASVIHSFCFVYSRHIVELERIRQEAAEEEAKLATVRCVN